MRKLILKAIRDEKGLTMEEVAKRVGTSVNTMVAIENGDKKCNDELKEKLCKLYDSDPEVIEWENQKNPAEMN